MQCLHYKLVEVTVNSKKENYVQEFGLCIGSRQIYSILGEDANKQITGSCPFPFPEQ
jgi:hypothetical protein